MANNNGAETYDHNRKIKTGNHGQMTRQQAKELRQKWSAKLNSLSDSDNGDNSSQSVTP